MLERAPNAGRLPELEQLVGSDRCSTAQLFQQRASATPESRFLQFQGQCWNYAQAWRCIGAYSAFFLSQQSTRAETGEFRVASYLGNRPEAMWTWLGTHAAGAVYVPLNRSHRGELLRDVLKRSAATVLVTEASALSELPDLADSPIRTLVICDSEPTERNINISVVSASDIEQLEPRYGRFAEPGELATVMFTSGTTGRSKAVRIPHNMLCRGAAQVAQAFGFNAQDVVHLWMPLFHISGQLHQTLAMVVVGGGLGLYPTFSASRFWAQVSECGATIFGGLPNVLNILWQQPDRPDDAQTSLRLGLFAMIPPAIHRDFERRFGVLLLDTYGMTEMEPVTLPRADQTLPLGSCGSAGPDFEIAIVDADGRPLADDDRGEITVRPRVPDVMMLGYEHDAEATVQLWRNLWWHTGDLGYRDAAGFIYVLGRLKHMIRRRGENISAWELEGIIAQHPAVAECAALGVPSPLGEEDVKVALVLKPETTFDPEEFRSFCTASMAHFMQPRWVEIRSELPLNDVGKVDKLRLVDNLGEHWDWDPRVA